jgi:hypothetical protein
VSSVPLAEHGQRGGAGARYRGAGEGVAQALEFLVRAASREMACCRNAVCPVMAAVLVCDAPPEGVVPGLEAGDLAVAGVRDLAGAGLSASRRWNSPARCCHGQGLPSMG